MYVNTDIINSPPYTKFKDVIPKKILEFRNSPYADDELKAIMAKLEKEL